MARPPANPAACPAQALPQARKGAKATSPDLESQIKKVESQVQPILNNTEFMDHLKSYPWPNMGPGVAPTMAYTAHDHLVINLDRRIRYYSERNDHKGYLSLLRDFLSMLRREQLKWSWNER